ncbi:MAG: hypothetical protein K2M46_00840 [Lachnospiraceae bacterium]|nr:hypothetical protein [Lachnospiraceae bacterium]
MKKHKNILFFVLALSAMVVLAIVVTAKQMPLTDNSEDVYIYEENELGGETNISSENYAPTEK